jgi:hypothetical protein
MGLYASKRSKPVLLRGFLSGWGQARNERMGAFIRWRMEVRGYFKIPCPDKGRTRLSVCLSVSAGSPIPSSDQLQHSATFPVALLRA